MSHAKRVRKARAASRREKRFAVHLNAARLHLAGVRVWPEPRVDSPSTNSKDDP